VKFIGAPNPGDPATNDPNYIKNLSTCAAKSNILQALKEQQSYQDNLTPEQIEEQNKGYLAWRGLHDRAGLGHPRTEARREGTALLVQRRGERADTQLRPAAGRGHLDE
jgi:hypothetical protein